MKGSDCIFVSTLSLCHFYTYSDLDLNVLSFFPQKKFTFINCQICITSSKDKNNIFFITFFYTRIQPTDVVFLFFMYLILLKKKGNLF